MCNLFSISIKPVLLIPLLSLFTACGGGNGGGNKTSSYGYNFSSASTMSSSVAVSSLSSSSFAPTTAPSTEVTNIGGTFVATGAVNVLLNTAGVISVAQQNKNGMTLYVFDNDAAGQSTCVSEGCVTAWPPLLADANAIAVAPLSVIQRSDGHSQWALRDRPLYFYSGDISPGNLIGEGVGGIWHVALLEPVAMSKSSLNANDGDYFTASGKLMVGAERLDRTGFSLYTFDNDTADVSNCTDACLTNWPALIADENDKAEKPYSIITRAPVGTNASVKQWAYQGKPLYFYIGDSAAGQTNGKAINKWHLARPQPTQIKSNAALGSLLSGAGLVKAAIPVNSIEQTYNIPKHGFTLYTFDNDIASVSNCTASCLLQWPALIASSGAVAQAPFSLIARASGEYQWALNAKPLYFYAADTSPGDFNGENVDGIWHVARIPPVAADSNGVNGLLFTAHGNIVNESGVTDNARDGFTLYTVTTDSIGQSNCNDACLSTWPALFAPGDATNFGDFSVITRTGGAKQWAYKDKPLYFYSGDTQAGEVNGIGGNWFVAKP
jgi:predicted lipoprotein with Yx(FWY)xxD motif